MVSAPWNGVEAPKIDNDKNDEDDDSDLIPGFGIPREWIEDLWIDDLIVRL